MEIIKNTVTFKLHNTAVAVGKFDGLHKGHKHLIEQLLQAKKKGLKTVIFTFSKGPAEFTNSGEVQYILTTEEKYYFYKKLGVDILIEYPLNEAFLNISAKDFVVKILVGWIGMKYIVAGTDFRFGKDQRGNVEYLKELSGRLGYEVHVLKKEQFSHEDISSTRIRKLMSEGNLEKVNELLGYPYTIIGEVVRGNQLGRTVGMPTINLIPGEKKLLPPNGVYASCVTIYGKTYMGITNLGYKPTVTDKRQLGAETYILAFNQDVYGEEVVLELYSFIRPEKKFDSLAEVKKQVEEDLDVCRQRLKRKNEGNIL